MSIADEIKRLKELRDAGVLSASEFEQAKKGLLETLPQSAQTMPDKSYFVGKWRMGDASGDSFVLSFYADGRCKMKPQQPAGDVHWAWAKLMGVDAGVGQWWIEGGMVQFEVKMGNAALSYLLRKQGQAQTELESLKVCWTIVSRGNDEIRLRDENGFEQALSRLSSKP